MSAKRHSTSECVFFHKEPCACGRTFGEYLQERIDSGVERKAYDEQIAQRERERAAFNALLEAEGDEQDPGVFDPSVAEEDCNLCDAKAGEVCKPDCPNWSKP